jgi:hypothetical protein
MVGGKEGKMKDRKGGNQTEENGGKEEENKAISGIEEPESLLRRKCQALLTDKQQGIVIGCDMELMFI